MGNASNYQEDFFAIYTEIPQLSVYDFPRRLERSMFALCFKGEMRLQMDLNEYVIRENDFVLAAPGQIVQIYESSRDFEGFCFVANRELTIENRMDMEEMLPLFFYLKGNPVTHITHSERKIVMEYLVLLRHKMEDHSNHYRRELIYNLLRAFLYELSNMLYSRATIQKGTKSRKELQFETFIQRIGRSFRENRSVMFYANEMCLSPKHLSRVIKEVSGNSASEWIDVYVVMEAKRLLKTSRMTVDEISNELNFANQSFFGKYFKQHTGMTPSQYRNS